jgi:FkbM family methyltransferase
MKLFSTTLQVSALLLVIASSLCFYTMKLRSFNFSQQQDVNGSVNDPKSGLWQQGQSSSQAWWDIMTAEGSTSCREVQSNVQQGLWIDPNDGQYFVRLVQQPAHRHPFFVSVHKKGYDSLRYSSIFETGTYYEHLVQSRFERILQEGNEQSSSNNNEAIVSASSLPMVLDVGANIGYYSILSAARHHAVVSFEINPSNLIRLCDSIRWNQQQTSSTSDVINQATTTAPFAIRIFRNAVSNRHNEMVQVVVPKKNQGTGHVEPIKDQSNQQQQEQQAATLNSSVASTITLDDFAREHGWFTAVNTTTPAGSTTPMVNIAILKIDTEGHEPYVLEGAKQLLQSGIVRNVLLEYRTSFQPAVVSFLLDAGYVLVDDPPDVKTTKPTTTTMLTVEASREYIFEMNRAASNWTNEFGRRIGYQDLWFRWATWKLPAQ